MTSIYNAFGYAIDWQERYRLIRAAGFDGVMLWWSDGFGRGPGYREDPERARNAGLVVSTRRCSGRTICPLITRRGRASLSYTPSA